jgi:hypothetical protein
MRIEERVDGRQSGGLTSASAQRPEATRGAPAKRVAEREAEAALERLGDEGGAPPRIAAGGALLESMEWSG